MCGLSAVVAFDGGAALASQLRAMHACIPHRGPDGEGFNLLDTSWNCHAHADAEQLGPDGGYGAARVGLAFRWLQIQDLSPAAAQPMASPDGAVRLMFNGEIYNFQSLRRELEGLGHAFHSASDTEVVLAAYLQWGVAMFDRLDGMWAIVLLDVRARRLVTSRDRFGIKPLYYVLEGGRLLLASEVKQLLAAGASRAANVGAFARFIRGARPASCEETFFGAISAHPAASYCEIDLERIPRQLDFTPYWKLPDRGEDGMSFDEACERLDARLESTVAEHMAAQVPVGILASGGLDSSLVAALSLTAFAGRGQKPTAFSMTLAPGEALDESPWIERAVTALGYEGFHTVLEPAVLRERMAAITLAQEEPVAGIAVAGQYVTLALAAAKGVRVVLDGQGADEIFAGYPRHQAAHLASCVRRGAWLQALGQAGALAWRDPGFFGAALAGRRAARSRSAHARFLRSEPQGIGGGADTLDGSLRHDVTAGNLRWVLAVTDRNSMAHSVEARVPYVSRAVVELAFSLPDRFKVGAGRRKRILRRVAERHLPRELVYRKARIGFGAPAGRWLAGEFGAELRALPGSAAFAGALVDSAGLARYIDAFLAGEHGDAGTIWRLYALDQWARAYAVTGL